VTPATVGQPVVDHAKIATAGPAAMDLIIRRTRTAVDLARVRAASRDGGEGFSNTDRS
jgi:hypothetical protein